jgi:hypothetical protein
MTNAYYAGQDIDAPCGRCKGETRHRILSITDGVPEKLICVNCNSVHKFRLERPAAAPRSPRDPAAAPRVAAASPSRFQELMIAEQAGSRARPYAIKERWEEGMWMDHPTFGLGRVQKRQGRKVDVLFRTGLKTLISG